MPDLDLNRLQSLMVGRKTSIQTNRWMSWLMHPCNAWTWIDCKVWWSDVNQAFKQTNKQTERNSILASTLYTPLFSILNHKYKRNISLLYSSLSFLHKFVFYCFNEPIFRDSTYSQTILRKGSQYFATFKSK